MSLLHDLDCGGSGGFLAGLKGLGSGLVAISGVHGFWENNAEEKKRLKKQQEELDSVRNEWNSKLSQVRQDTDQTYKQLIQERIQLVDETHNLVETKLAVKIETNRSLIYGTIIIILMILLYLLTEPQS